MVSLTIALGMRSGGSTGDRLARIQSLPSARVPAFAISTDLDPLPSSSATAPLCCYVSKDFRTAYIQNFNLNTEYQLSPRTVLQIG